MIRVKIMHDEVERDLKEITKKIEKIIGTDISLLSTSPEREDTILIKDPFIK